jgi:L-cystine uptake protein TcyP (sodium:dicarboxylate symporter family)
MVKSPPGFSYDMKWTRKPGEPIYQRRHMIVLILAVVLPVVTLQLYKIYVGPVSFNMQLGLSLFIATILGLILHFIYRSSARNQP